MISRMPSSVAVSIGLHGAALLAFIGLASQSPKQAQRIVDGVDLLIQSPKPRDGAVKPPPLSTMDFLKLALPQRSLGGPASITLKTPEHKIKLADAPKLDEMAKKELGPKLKPLDLSEKRAGMAKVTLEGKARAHATLAAMPRLEEVGRRRVKNLPEALALEDKRREASAAGLPALGVGAKAPSRGQALAAMAALKEEEAPRPGAGAPRPGLALPGQPIDLRASRPVDAAPRPVKPAAEAAPVPKRQAQIATNAAPAKGVEIEGPLADRRVLAFDVPPFPTWLQSQGILEASVGIRFTVDEEGSVMNGMRVVVSSGYGRLDKLAMESLKSWRFEPKPGAGVQWGVITFRFVVE